MPHRMHNRARHARICQMNARQAARRASEPTVDFAVGAGLFAAGFFIGPPILGLIFGVPLAAVGVWGMGQGGYPQKQSQWSKRLTEDMERVSRGHLPVHAKNARENLSHKGYKDPDL